MKNIKYFIILIVAIFLVGCRTTPPIVVVTDPIKRIPLNLPKIVKFKAKKVKWIIVTEENVNKVFNKLKNEGKDPVIFGLSDVGYENVSLNLIDIRQLVLQQKAHIDAYKYYYIEQNKLMDEQDKVIEDKLNYLGY